MKYNRLTYLGWVRLEQSRREEAETYLQNASNLDTEPGQAYCLLAQVLQARRDPVSAKTASENCEKSTAQPDEKSVEDEV